MEESPALYFTFGIIADIQYADIANGFNYTKTRMRYYRNSLALLKGAIGGWAEERRKPEFILQLGDLIDGFNARDKRSEISLQKVLTEIEKLDVQFHHVWGNHEFYNFSRKFLLGSKLNTKPLADMMDDLTVSSPSSDCHEDSFYGYHFSPFNKFRFLLIDTYDLSAIGRGKPSVKYEISLKLLKEKNPNEDLNSPTGLKEPQYVQFNGGVSGDQLTWINRVLTSSDEKQEKVIVVGHLPIHPEATDTICLAWNYQEILSLLQSHSCVLAYLAGHDHDGGYCADIFGIHHVTFKGVIETPPESQAYGTMYVYEDKMVLKGQGHVLDRTLHYRETRTQTAQ
ncbi:hypothetical protein GDO86_013770 [Hymenochirus boettgeri]|uniref:Manganese-dependent ADP-ribose/CDP-alcohol diphosphatase n=1 Tax=Hymenochirus boettgeri TaxID=247094 RepID=A0A8T2JQE7_9PIPI|nr:hypothetical protein GDO86_013770 [Hymenochirus boettgeri]